MGDWGGVDSLANEFNIVALDVLDHHNLLLCEEVQSKVTNGLTQHALLKK